MIILTTPKISHWNPIRVSSVIKYAYGEFCLAEIDDNNAPTRKDMNKHNLDFWWELNGGYIDGDEYSYKKFAGGLVEGIENTYGLSKEKNIAIGIFEIANNAGLDPFELWENSILKKR